MSVHGLHCRKRLPEGKCRHRSLLQLHVGGVSYFSFIVVVHEHSWINWIGHLQQEEENQCYFVEKTDVAQNPVVDVEQLSTPSIHAVEDGIMWIISLL